MDASNERGREGKWRILRTLRVGAVGAMLALLGGCSDEPWSPEEGAVTPSPGAGPQEPTPNAPISSIYRWAPELASMVAGDEKEEGGSIILPVVGGVSNELPAGSATSGSGGSGVGAGRGSAGATGGTGRTGAGGDPGSGGDVGSGGWGEGGYGDGGNGSGPGGSGSGAGGSGGCDGEAW